MRVILVIFLLAGVPASVAAQAPFESVGSRALGMAGAFVGVADDVTAAWWNPAGMATGPIGSATVEWSRFQKRDPSGPVIPGGDRGGSSFTGIGSWPVAVSFGRVTTTEIVEGPGLRTSARSLSASQYAVTVLQTVVHGLVIGSTLKYVRGTAASGPVPDATVEAALDAVDALGSRTSGAFDLDLGLMADLDRVRLGVTWKNLRSPDFETLEGTAITLPRQARFGLAVLPTDGLTLAMDIDLDTVDLRGGLRRMIAFGAETVLGPRAALRGGVRWNLEGARRPVTAVGASLALRPQFWLDGYYSYGPSEVDRGFGIALRAGT
ncbi:MAG TPA: conjugal transfer protein TraF [Vicinamibacterales bacterium]|nr:conjugal transfer protein TraF [Vicinamibacterales bacterium]